MYVARVDGSRAPGNGEGRPPLAVGMFVDAAILGRTVDDAIVLPRAALRGEDRVLVVDAQDRLTWRRVTVLRADRDTVIVGAGLRQGERVVLSPLEAPVEGMPVRPVLETTFVKGAIAWLLAENGVAANLLMIVILVGGLLALPRIKQEVFPDVRIEMVTVTVPYRGATPEEVEEGVCVRVEEAVQGVEGIKRILSTATEGAGVVTIELEPDADMRQAVDDLKARVDAIDTFPAETEKPIVQQVVMRSQVINVAVSGATSTRRRSAISASRCATTSCARKA